MQGVIAAAPTPIDSSGAPIEALYLEHCDWLLRNGCDGLNILGSTGEANSFPQQARRDVMGWASHSFDTARLMVGTATPSLGETIAMTRVADDLDFPVALVLPPYYYKPLSDQGLIAWYMALHEALDKRSIQIYFYNYPQMTGLTIPVAVIKALSEAAPSRFTGIKDSSGDLDYARAIVAANASLKVFPSSETVLHHAKNDGFAGCISASVNLTAPCAARVWAGQSDASEADISSLAEERGALAGPNLIAGIKHMVAERTGDIRWQQVLPPLTTLSPEDGAALTNHLKG